MSLAAKTAVLSAMDTADCVVELAALSQKDQLEVVLEMPEGARVQCLCGMLADDRTDILAQFSLGQTAATLLSMAFDDRERALLSMSAERRSEVSDRMKDEGGVMWMLQMVLIQIMCTQVGLAVKVWSGSLTDWKKKLKMETKGLGGLGSLLVKMPSDKLVRYLDSLGPFQAKGLISSLSRGDRSTVLGCMPEERKIDVLGALPHAERAAALQTLPQSQTDAILSSMDKPDLLAVLLAMPVPFRASCLASGSLTMCTNAFTYMSPKEKAITVSAMPPKASAEALAMMSDRTSVICVMSPDERDASLATMETALRIATLADVHVVFGMQAIAAADCDTAESNLRKALEIAPMHLVAWSQYLYLFKYNCVNGTAQSSAGGGNGLSIKSVRSRAVREWSKHLDPFTESGMKRPLEPMLQVGALCVKGLDKSIACETSTASAKRMFQSAIELCPSHAMPYLCLGILMGEQLKDVNLELRLYKHAISLQPKFSAAYIFLANLVQSVRNDHDLAGNLCKHALELDPACAVAHCTLGELMSVRRSSNKAQRKFDIEATIRLYKNAMRVNPRYSPAYRSLGTLLMRVVKDYAAAKKNLTKASELGDDAAKKLLVELNDAQENWNADHPMQARPELPTRARLRRNSMKVVASLKLASPKITNEDAKEDTTSPLLTSDNPRWKTAGTAPAWDYTRLVPQIPIMMHQDRLSTPADSALCSLQQAKNGFNSMINDPLDRVMRDLRPSRVPRSQRKGGRTARTKDLVECLPGLNMMEISLNGQVHKAPQPPATTREMQPPRSICPSEKKAPLTHRDSSKRNEKGAGAPKGETIRNKFALDFSVMQLRENIGGVINKLTDGGLTNQPGSQSVSLNKHAVIPSIARRPTPEAKSPEVGWKWGQKLPRSMLAGDNPSVVLDCMRNFVSKPASLIKDIQRRGINLAQLRLLESFVKQVLEAVVVRDISTNSAVYGSRIVWSDRVKQQEPGPVVRPSMYHICDHFVKRLTDKLHCSFVELITTVQQSPKWFVSHAYSTSFEDTIRMLNYHSDVHSPGCDNSSFWIDTFARDVHTPEQLCQPLHRTGIWNSIRKCNGLVQVMDDDCTPHQRTWCLLEVYMATVMQGKPFELLSMVGRTRRRSTEESTSVSKRRQSLRHGSPALKDASGREWCQQEGAVFPTHIAEKGLLVSIATSQTLSKGDRDSILRLIADVDDVTSAPPTMCAGYDRVNWGIRRLFCGPALISLARAGDFLRCHTLIHENPESVVDHMDQDGATATHIATSKGDELLLKLLAKSSANLDLCDHQGKTPLIIAAKKGNNALVLALVRLDATVDIQRDDLASPLSLAARNGHTEVVCSLAEHKADLNMLDAGGLTPIYHAISHNRRETAQALLVLGARQPTKLQQEAAIGIAQQRAVDTNIALQVHAVAEVTEEVKLQ